MPPLLIRNLHTLIRTGKHINFLGMTVTEACYCSKQQFTSETQETDSQSRKCAQLEERKTTPKVEILPFESEKKILQAVMLEKEKDANVRSRLSKECNKLLDKKIKLSSTGLNLHLDPNTTQSSCWEDYAFDKTVHNLKIKTGLIEANTLQDNICLSKIPVKISDKTRKSDKQTDQSGGDDVPPVAVGRIIRGEPGKVLFAFIPYEWFTFFIPKTGVTGFGTFLFTFGTFLVSKEYYVLEHNYYNGLGMLVLWWGVLKYVGPHVAKYLDNEVDNYEKAWQKERDESKKILEEGIKDEQHALQFQAEGQLMLIEAKRENVHLQLEEAFRLRQMYIYQEVLNRLNYHVVVAKVRKKIFQKNLVEYVTREVRKAITPEMEKQMFSVSIEHLVAELEKGGDKKY